MLILVLIQLWWLLCLKEPGPPAHKIKKPLISDGHLKDLNYLSYIYNLFRLDRSSKSGRVRIYTKEHFKCSIVLTRSIQMQFILLILNIKCSNKFNLLLAECYHQCYHPPSALGCPLTILCSALVPFIKTDFVLCLGDLNCHLVS